MLLILDLPVEILARIFQNVSIQDLKHLLLVCKTFKEIILNENSIWKKVCRDIMIININSSDPSVVSWYDRLRVSYNWHKGIFRRKVIVRHKINYMPWLAFYETKALLLSCGHELFCYPVDKHGMPVSNPQWLVQVPTIKRGDIRTNDISKFVVKDNLIVCGNRDGCATVYQMNDVKRKPSLLYHICDCHNDGQVEVSAVELINTHQLSYVVTGSRNTPCLKFWLRDHGGHSEFIPTTSLDTQCHQYLNNIIDCPLIDNGGITCMAANAAMDKLAVGINADVLPVVLDVQVCKKMAETKPSIGRRTTRDVQWFNENTVVYVTYSGHVQLMDIRNSQVIYSARDPFNSSLYSVKSDGDRAIVVGSSEYGRCVLYDVRHQRYHIQLYFTQKRSSPVYSLDMNSSMLVAAADRSVNVLDFNVNTYSCKQKDYSHVFDF